MVLCFISVLGISRAMVDKYLRIDGINLDLKSDSKEEVIKELYNLLDFIEIINGEECLDAILCREAISSTGIGRGIAIPNAKSSSVLSTQVAMGVSKRGINFGSIDFEDAKIFFLIVSPLRDKGINLSLVNKVAKMMRKEEIRNRILSAKKRNEIIGIIK